MATSDKRHYLVVDDQPLVRDVIRMALEYDGSSRVSCAGSADEALAAILRDIPDAAIVDAVLPKVSGLWLARQIADLGVPVLLTSGNPACIGTLADIGCPFLAKPFRLDQLWHETRLLIDDASDRAAALALALARYDALREETTALHAATRSLLDRVRQRLVR